MHLTHVPAVKVGLLMRKPPADTFAAIADPAITTRFWYTKSTGPMTEGAELIWEWEMYGASARIRVHEVEQDRRIRFSWSGYNPEHPTTVEFGFIPWQDGTTYVQVTETGFSGDGDTIVARIATRRPASPSCWLRSRPSWSTGSSWASSWTRTPWAWKRSSSP